MVLFWQCLEHRSGFQMKKLLQWLFLFAHGYAISQAGIAA